MSAVDDWSRVGKTYWEDRYKLYTSGSGSVAEERAWKWGVIEEYVKEIDHVIDIGCGDLLFWEGRNPSDYTGIDIAENRIDANRKMKPNWNFIASPAEVLIEGLHKPNVLCIDTLFHIMETRGFVKILRNLCVYSTEFIFVHTWRKNPFFPNWSDGKYQYFRPMEKYLRVFRDADFALLEARSNPISEIGAMYIFNRTVNPNQ